MSATAPTVRTRPVRRPRFDGTERAVHWVTAVVALALVATGAVMYVGPLAGLVGHRGTVRTVHFWCGVVVPVPLVLGLLAPRRGRALRADARALERLDADDRAWLRRRPSAGPGKFNAGQKLNTAFLLGAGVVLFLTGLMLRAATSFPVTLRTGATFVHDWFAIGLTLLVLGHVVLALRDPGALAGITRGSVRVDWARRHHPRWTDPDGVPTGDPTTDPTTDPDGPSR